MRTNGKSTTKCDRKVAEWQNEFDTEHSTDFMGTLTQIFNFIWQHAIV